MKLLLIFPVLLSFALVRDVGVGARPNTDGLHTVDAATSVATSSPLSWLNMGSNMIKDRLSFDENIWNTALEFGNNAAQVAASLGSQIVERGTDYVKQGLQSAIPLGNSSIDEGSDLTTQVLGLIRAGFFSSEIGKTAVNTASGVGTNALNAVNIFEDRNLSFINNFSQMGTNALSSIVNSRTSLGQDMITSGTHAIRSLINTGFDVLQQLIDGIQNLPSEGNRISDSLNVVREGSVSTRNILRVPPR